MCVVKHPCSKQCDQIDSGLGPHCLSGMPKLILDISIYMQQMTSQGYLCMPILYRDKKLISFLKQNILWVYSKDPSLNEYPMKCCPFID